MRRPWVFVLAIVVFGLSFGISYLVGQARRRGMDERDLHGPLSWRTCQP